MKSVWSVFLAAAFACGAMAQEASGDKVSVAFSDPSRPGLVKVSLIHGSITITGYNGKEVVIEARNRTSSRRSKSAPDGLKRIDLRNSGLTVEEQNNVMSIGAASLAHPVDFTIQVPVKTNLKLHTINSGNVKVEGVDGEIEVNNVNGGATLTNISGSAVAHALNGKILATFARIDAGKPMSFSSMNGAIDVTFPGDLKANVRLKSEHGEIYTDFDVTITPDSNKPVVQDSRSKNGKYRVQVDRSIVGSINGGGAEIQFKNFNGPIYIRKTK
jgi:DUF4097 and DUF4098 domain-containing protein YvlB